MWLPGTHYTKAQQTTQFPACLLVVADRTHRSLQPEYSGGKKPQSWLLSLFLAERFLHYAAVLSKDTPQDFTVWRY